MTTSARQMNSAIAVCDGQIVGHAAVEPLTEHWHEIGAVWTDPKPREGGGPHRHVGLRLCSALLERHRDKCIIMTIVNPAMMVVGWRTGMVPITYDQLPEAAWRATCCCPQNKTGVPREQNVPHCALRQRTCFVQVTRETWRRLDRPVSCTLPVAPHHQSRHDPQLRHCYYPRRVTYDPPHHWARWICPFVEPLVLYFLRY